MPASLCKTTDLFTWHAVWGDHLNPLLIYTSSQLEGGVWEKVQYRLWMSISGIMRRVYIRPGERPREEDTSWPERQERRRKAVTANKWWVFNFQITLRIFGIGPIELQGLRRGGTWEIRGRRLMVGCSADACDLGTAQTIGMKEFRAFCLFIAWMSV